MSISLLLRSARASTHAANFRTNLMGQVYIQSSTGRSSRSRNGMGRVENNSAIRNDGSAGMPMAWAVTRA